MSKNDVINISACSAISLDGVRLLRDIQIKLNDIDALRIEQKDNGTVIYFIYLSNGSIFQTDDKDGFRVIEALRKRTAEQYKN